jgi:predicted nuclease with TOPRIM domain
VPKKYHEFMILSVRRVYIEIPSQAALKNQIALMESRVKSLEKDKVLLMTKCESNMAASATHAEGEKKARLDVEKARREMTDLKRKYDTLKGKYNDLKSRWVSVLVLFRIFCS